MVHQARVRRARPRRLPLRRVRAAAPTRCCVQWTRGVLRACARSDFGIRCIISTSFADIFFNNCFKNGMLPVTLPQEQVFPTPRSLRLMATLQ